MLASSVITSICFIACHGAPADPFASFAESLTQKGYEVQIYATGPALKKFQDRQTEALIPFSLEGTSFEVAAVEIAKSCSQASVVITDLGHEFDIALQQALSIHAKKTLRLTYYENPESYVPGGYSATAAKVMQLAQGVLFSNATHATAPIYRAPLDEVEFPEGKRAGIGYYPLEQVHKVVKRRESEHALMRSLLFSKYSVEDRGQKVLVYAGGNNEEYFCNAFPAFLSFLKEALQQGKPSDYLFLLQQHPGAKKENRDVNLVAQCGPLPLFVSDFSSDEAQVAADGMLYYQTSIAPQFVLAGLPTIQVGHNTYEDLLVRNGLCTTANSPEEFLSALANLQMQAESRVAEAAIYKSLGICADWEDRLEQAIRRFYPF